MQAQVLEEYNRPYDFRSVPVPKPTAEYDVLVRVEASSYCHTDAVLASGQMKPNPPKFPHIGCHEFAGTVVEVSPRFSKTSPNVKVGDRVGVPGRAYGSCGKCLECADETHPENDPAGFSMFCPQATSNGISKDGGFANYALVDARQISPLPGSMSAVDAAPLMCAGITIYAALKRCQLSPGQRVGIIGCGGGLGHLGVQFANAMGLRVTGVDAADGPLELATSVAGTARIVDARAEQASEVVEQMGTDDKRADRATMGLDAVIILPESQLAFDYGIQLLRNHGLCVVVSFPETPFALSARDLVFRDIRVVGTLLGSVRTIREMLEFAALHDIKAIKKTFPLAKLNDLVEEYHRGEGGKLVVDLSLG